MWKEIKVDFSYEKNYVDLLGVFDKQPNYYNLRLIFGSIILIFLFWNAIFT